MTGPANVRFLRVAEHAIRFQHGKAKFDGCFRQFGMGQTKQGFIHQLAKSVSASFEQLRRLPKNTPFDGALKDRVLEAGNSLVSIGRSLQAHEKDVLLKIFEAAMFTHDISVCRHQRRVEELVQKMARRPSLLDIRDEQVVLAAALHDIGSIAVDKHILQNWEILGMDEKRFYLSMILFVGYHILNEIEGFENAAQIVLNSQAPRRMRDRSLGLEAQIVSAADFYDRKTTRGRNMSNPISRADCLVAINERAYDIKVIKALDEVTAVDRQQQIFVYQRNPNKS